MKVKDKDVKRVKDVVESIPLIGPMVRNVAIRLRTASFPGSQMYWESRYASGGASGPGSYGKLAEFKAEVLNSFVKDHEIRSVIEFGCGDGNQLSLANYPAYIGLDVSKTAIEMCKERFKHDGTKRFFLYDPDDFVELPSIRAELALSLDVIFHLIEDRIFELYMRHLFSAAEKFVIVYSTDTDINPSWPSPHFKNRVFSKWVKTNLPEWKLLRRIPNKYPYEGGNWTGSRADFFIYNIYDTWNSGGDL